MSTVDLYEGPGGLYVAFGGRAWALGWLDESARFTEDAELLSAGEEVVSSDAEVDLGGLVAEATTRHVATWRDGIATEHVELSKAAARYVQG